MEWIQVAGTNGKGSTSIYLSEILNQSAKCGLFTSPHINTPCERFKIGDSQISNAEYDALLNRHKNSVDEVGAISGMFNIWTNMAIDWFGQHNLDYGVMETGLGGRKDPTNVVDSKIQVITPVDFDHTEQLGNTIRKISREKCGIIKRESKVISHPQNYETTDVIMRACDRQNCEPVFLDRSKITIHSEDLNGILFSFHQNNVHLDNVKLNSFAHVQVDNACAAALAASELGVGTNDIINGIVGANIPGRIQFIDDIILDAAHNPAALKILAQTIKRLFPKRHITVITAVMKDKDIYSISDVIASFADYVICTRADKKRGLETESYKALFSKAGSYENPAYAFEQAKYIAQRKNGLIVVCGSFYLLPYIYKLLQL